MPVVSLKYCKTLLYEELVEADVTGHDHCSQGHHTPDDMKFPDNSGTFPWRFAVLVPMLSVTHIMPVLVLLSVVGVGMQQCMIKKQNVMHKFSKVKNECKYAVNNKQF